MAEGFVSDFRRFFLRGLAAVLPTVLTLMVIIYVFKFVQKYIGQYINFGLLAIWWRFWGQEAHLPPHLATYEALALWWHGWFWWVGFLLAIVGVYIFGRFVASFLGRGFWRFVERALLRAPLVRAIYPSVKQVTDFLFSQQKIEFSRVVAVEYPRKGVWSLGLVTSAGMRKLQHAMGGNLLTVFVPSSPMPVTGYTITIRRDEVIDLPMSIDDALRFTVSGGVIMPPDQRLSQIEIEQARQGVFPSLDRSKETTT